MKHHLSIQVIEVNPKNGDFIQSFDSKLELSRELNSSPATIASASKNKQVYTIKKRLFAEVKGVDLTKTDDIFLICQTAYVLNELRQSNRLDLDNLHNFVSSAPAVLYNEQM